MGNQMLLQKPTSLLGKCACGLNPLVEVFWSSLQSLAECHAQDKRSRRIFRAELDWASRDRGDHLIQLSEILNEKTETRRG